MCLTYSQFFTAIITRQEEVREQEREAEMRDTEMLLADRIRFDVLMLSFLIVGRIVACWLENKSFLVLVSSSDCCLDLLLILFVKQIVRWQCYLQEAWDWQRAWGEGYCWEWKLSQGSTYGISFEDGGMDQVGQFCFAGFTRLFGALQNPECTKCCRKYKEDTEGKKAELERVRQVEFYIFDDFGKKKSKISVKI